LAGIDDRNALNHDKRHMNKQTKTHNSEKANVRLVKRHELEQRTDQVPPHTKQADRDPVKEMAATVTAWVREFQQKNRAERRIALKGTS
jgi:hypothetical protein